MQPATGAAASIVDVRDLVARVHGHRLYAQVRDERSLRVLMRSHVFAVLDFQSLLKALQRGLTCTTVPWLPTADPEARRLVNEIVLDEESDPAPWGGHASHFEIYLRAMQECGADSRPVEAYVAALRAGSSVAQALAAAPIAPAVGDFVRTTMQIAQGGEIHRIAAAFSFGREDIIPEMFQQLVGGLVELAPARWATFHHYLVRHIERDGERHAPLARQLVEKLCGGNPQRCAEAEATARTCLEARIALWDQILAELLSGAAGRG